MTRHDIVYKLRDLTALSWDERATTSGTAGTYLKSRSGSGLRMIFYKLSRYNGREIDGHECVNEIVASRLMGILGIPHLEYRLVHATIEIDGASCETWLNTSHNFRRPGERKQGLDLFYQLRKHDGETPYEFCARMGWEDDVKRMMLTDYLIANRDRHGSNIEVLVGRDGVPRLAPLFDNGLSLVAPYAANPDALLAFDPLQDVATTNFVGSRFLEENLLAAAPVPGVGELRQSDREVLLRGLDAVLPDEHLQKIWEIIWQRWRHYEDVRDNR